jgi:membrane-associated phospholipid phosphatase
MAEEIDPPESLAVGLAERTAWALGITTLWAIGYFGLGYAGDARNGRNLATALDGRIPFIANSVWVYLLGLTGAALPLFALRCPRLFRRSAVAYIAVILASLACFAVFPVTSIRLRPEVAMSNFEPLSSWAMQLLYAHDPPLNLFPSLHVSIGVIAAFSIWKASRRFGAGAFVLAALVGISVCTVKQHFVVDVLGGIGLAGVVNALLLRPYTPPNVAAPLHSPLGVVIYVACVIASYMGLYAAYLLAL